MIFMAEHTAHWGDALRRHLDYAGVRTAKELMARTDASQSAVSKWFRAREFPEKMQMPFVNALCGILGLAGREQLRRLPYIEPEAQTLRVPADDAGRVAWREVDPLTIPEPHLISGLVQRGVTPQTVSQVMEEIND